MSSVIVLNMDFTYLNTTSWQNAICLVHKCKAEIVKATDEILSNFDKSIQYAKPIIIRLISFVSQIHKNSIPFSKKGVFTRDNYVCQYCMTKLELNEATVDHVYPSSKGGKSTWVNCVTACHGCNQYKGDRLLDDITIRLKCIPTAPKVADYMRNRAKIFKIDDLLKEL